MSRQREPLWLQPADAGAWTPAYRRAVRRRCWAALAVALALIAFLLSPAWAGLCA